MAETKRYAIAYMTHDAKFGIDFIEVFEPSDSHDACAVFNELDDLERDYKDAHKAKRILAVELAP